MGKFHQLSTGLLPLIYVEIFTLKNFVYLNLWVNSLSYITEQQYFEIEKQLIESNTKLEAESSSNIQLREQLKELGKFVAFFLSKKHTLPKKCTTPILH